ncbi:MAG: hypothetical protein RI923_561, partial [Pseudomonadota bacterium]
ADGFQFPALQADAGFKARFQMVFVACGLVQGNRFLALACAILVGILLHHRSIVAYFA